MPWHIPAPSAVACDMIPFRRSAIPPGRAFYITGNFNGFSCYMKKQEIPLRISPVKIHLMTSYDGIIRIRLKGRSSITSSQPANELPCFYQICNVSMLNHRQIYYSASGEIFKCDFLVHFYPLSFHDQGQRKRPPDSGESHNATQKNR